VDPTVELIVDEPETSTETMAEVVMAELDPPEPPAPPAPPPDAVEVTVEEGTVFKVVSVVVATLLDPPDAPAPPAVAAIHWLANCSEEVQLCETPWPKERRLTLRWLSMGRLLGLPLLDFERSEAWDLEACPHEEREADDAPLVARGPPPFFSLLGQRPASHQSPALPTPSPQS
jgi:hypothetical protein